mgnify:FL=1
MTDHARVEALLQILRDGIAVLNRQGHAIAPEQIDDRARNIAVGVLAWAHDHVDMAIAAVLETHGTGDEETAA